MPVWYPHFTDPMIRATPELRTAAERLLGLEAAAGKRAGAKPPAASRVNERFRHVLSTLLGAAGYRALLVRALTLATAEVPELSVVEVQADASLEGLNVAEKADKRRFAEGEVVLVAHLLGLLVIFLGEALMLRLVNDAWPKVRLDDLDFEKGAR
jgi:hypothetical protein